MIRKEFILSELKYRYPDMKNTIRQPEQAVGRPLLFEQEKRAVGSRIIVCRAEDLDSVPDQEQREPLFLCLGLPCAELLDKLDICILPESEHIGNILNFVQRLFDRLDEWTDRLKQAAESGADANQLFAGAAEMLQNPIFLLDNRRHIIASSDQTIGEHSAIDFSSYKLPDQNALQQRRVIRYMTGEGGEDALIAPISLGKNHFYLICPAVERSFYGSDEIVFESLAGYARLLLSEKKIPMRSPERSPEIERVEKSLLALLEGTEPEHAVVEDLQNLGWRSEEEYTLLAIEPTDGDLRDFRASAICDFIEKSFGGCCSFTFLPVIVVMIRSNHDSKLALQKRMFEIVETEHLRIGAFDAMKGFSFFSQRLELAKQTLNRVDPAGGAICFSEYFDEFLIDRITTETPAELVCLQSVFKIARYDNEHKTNYIETAEQYIKNRFNAVKTANALFIHRSTFLYRLERMKTQFGLDLDSDDISLLHLLLSIRMMRTIEKQ